MMVLCFHIISDFGVEVDHCAGSDSSAGLLRSAGERDRSEREDGARVPREPLQCGGGGVGSRHRQAGGARAPRSGAVGQQEHGGGGDEARHSSEGERRSDTITW